MSDAASQSQPRMTRSKARAAAASGSTTPVKMLSDAFKSATSLLGKSRGKKAADAESPAGGLVANLFSKTNQQADSTQEFAARDQGLNNNNEDAPAPMPTPAAAPLEAPLAPTPPVSPMPAVNDHADAPAPMPAPAAAPLDASPAPPPASPTPPSMDLQYTMTPFPTLQLDQPDAADAMAVSPAPMMMDVSPAPAASLSSQPFGTPLEMVDSLSPMQLMSPAVMDHAYDLADEGTCIPQQPATEDFTFELPKADELAGCSAAATPVMDPSCQAQPAEPAAAPAAPLAFSTPPRVQPLEGNKVLKTPRSAAVPGVVSRLTAKPPLSSSKPSVGLQRSGSSQRAPPSSSTPKMAALDASAEVQAGQAASKAPLAPAAAGVTPSLTKSASAKTSNVNKTVKRVSIATPLASNPGSAASKPVVRTPYPRSGSKTPVERLADAMEEQQVPSPEAAAGGALSAASTPRMEALAPAAAPDPSQLFDAAMLLATALPPSHRTTCEETPAADSAVQCPTPAATPAPSPAPAPQDGMDVDDDGASPSAGFTLAPSLAVEEEESTPEFKPLPSSSLKHKPFGTPTSAAAAAVQTPPTSKHSAVRMQQVDDSARAVLTPSRLTIPAGGASYMASTKSFENKAKPLQPEVAAAPFSFQSRAPAAASAAMRPRVKSEVMSTQQDHRSVKQLKREIKAALEAKTQPEPKGLESDDEMEEAPYSQADESMLVKAMSTKIQIGPGKVALRGLPAPQGTHVRFQDDGKAVASPGSTKVLLKGLPKPTGTHTRF